MDRDSRGDCYLLHPQKLHIGVRGPTGAAPEPQDGPVGRTPLWGKVQHERHAAPTLTAFNPTLLYLDEEEAEAGRRTDIHVDRQKNCSSHDHSPHGNAHHETYLDLLWT